MAERRQGKCPHVVDAHLQTSLHQRTDPAAEDQRLGSARRASVADVLSRQRIPGPGLGLGRQHEADGIVPDVRRHKQFRCHGSQFEDLPAVKHGVHLRLDRHSGPLHDRRELVPLGILNQDLHEEAVQLRLRQRVCAFHFQRVLRRHHQERLLEGVSARPARDRLLLHRLQ